MKPKGGMFHLQRIKNRCWMAEEVGVDQRIRDGIRALWDASLHSLRWAVTTDRNRQNLSRKAQDWGRDYSLACLKLAPGSLFRGDNLVLQRNRVSDHNYHACH